MNAAWLLITSAAGYWVLTLAQHQKGSTKSLGRWLGAVIILVSLAGTACTIYCAVSGKAVTCPPMGKAWGACPLSSAMCSPKKSAACPMMPTTSSTSSSPSSPE